MLKNLQPTEPLVLRDYQTEALDGLRAALKTGARRVVLAAPTGAGKTVIAGAIMAAVYEKGRSALFVADRRVLVKQTSLRLAAAGIRHGVYMAGATHGVMEPIRVASAQTLERRHGWPAPDEVSLVIVDECHTLRKTTTARTAAYAEAGVPTIGLTATPFPKGLGKIYERCVSVVPTNRLVQDGWLVGIRAYVAKPINMSGLPTPAGEWSDADCERRVLPIIGDLVGEWERRTKAHFGGPVKTLVFAPTVAAADQLAARYSALGLGRFEALSYRSRPELTDAAIQRFRTGATTGLVSCEKLAKGFDVPDARCLVIARPYRSSLTAHVQMLGRVMRAAPGKEYGLVLDHARNCARFQAETEEFWARGRDWLDQEEEETRVRNQKRMAAKPECPECGFIRPPGSIACPSCGFAGRRTDPTKWVEGTLAPLLPEEERHTDFWADVCTLVVGKRRDLRSKRPDELARLDRKHPGYRACMAIFRKATGNWPEWGRAISLLPEGMEPDMRVQSAVADGHADFDRQKRAVERDVRAWNAFRRLPDQQRVRHPRWGIGSPDQFNYPQPGTSPTDYFRRLHRG